MPRAAPGILKKQQTRPAEPRRVGDECPAAGHWQVRLLQQTEAGAVIEVTCACGRKTALHCDYADPGPASA